MCNCNSCILACMPWFCMLSVNEETLFFVNAFQSGNFTPSFFICTPPHLTLLSIYEHQLLLSGIIGSCTWRPFSSAKKFTVVINYQHFTRIHTNNLAQNCERKVFISFHTILHIQPMFVRRCVDENEENFQTLLNSSQQTYIRTMMTQKIADSYLHSWLALRWCCFSSPIWDGIFNQISTQPNM